MFLNRSNIFFLACLFLQLINTAHSSEFRTKKGILYKNYQLADRATGTLDPRGLVWIDEIANLKDIVEDCIQERGTEGCSQSFPGTSYKSLSLVKIAEDYCKATFPGSRIFTEEEYDLLIGDGAIDSLPHAMKKSGGQWVGYLSKTPGTMQDGYQSQIIFGGESKTDTASDIQLREATKKVKFEIPLAVRCVIANQNLTSQNVLATFKDTPWVLMGSTKGGITVSSKSVPGSKVYAFRGEGIVQAPLSTVASILVDFNRYTEWVDKMASFELLNEDNYSYDNFIGYHIISAPTPIWNRDFVVQYRLKRISKDSLIFHMDSTDEITIVNKKNVRGKIIESTYVISRTSDQATHVVVEIHANPNGWIPNAIVNLFQSEWPYNTISNLRKQAAKSDIEVSKDVTEILK